MIQRAKPGEACLHMSVSRPPGESRHGPHAVVCQQLPVVPNAQYVDRGPQPPSRPLPQPWHCASALDGASEGPPARMQSCGQRRSAPICVIQMSPTRSQGMVGSGDRSDRRATRSGAGLSAREERRSARCCTAPPLMRCIGTARSPRPPSPALLVASSRALRVSAKRPLATIKRGAGRARGAGSAYPRQRKSRASVRPNDFDHDLQGAKHVLCPPRRPCVLRVLRARG